MFLLGTVGAMAPEIVRLYEIRNNPERFQWSGFYLAVSLAFAVLGGLLAVAMPATTSWGALYIGASTPVLINSIARKARKREQLRSWPSAPARYSTVDSYVHGL